MISEPIISVSGLRGVVGESLSPDLAIRYVAAFCASLPQGPIVVSCDGRATGPMLARAIESAVVASGRDCLECDVAATPTTGVLVRSLGAAGGVQISASHNPPEYNGLKLFSSEGRVIPADAGERVLEAYRNGATAWAAHDALGAAQRVDDTTSAHLNSVLETVNRDRIRKRGFRVILDANHGAGAVLGRPLLSALGCDVTVIGEEPHGHFAHAPEPITENLKSITDKAQELNADVTFCQDPDADRLAVIDENGRYLGEELTLALCAEHRLAERKDAGDEPASAAIVTNCSTSRMTEDIANKYGAPFFRSAVGEANVVDVMREHDAILGGEGNGGVIDPRVGWVRDSFVGMAMLLDAMARTGEPISKLANALPQYAIHKAKAPLDRAGVAAAFDRIESHFAGAEFDRMDGLRLDWPGKWLLIRASNTEPIVRIIAEAEFADEAKRLCDEAASVLEP